MTSDSGCGTPEHFSIDVNVYDHVRWIRQEMGKLKLINIYNQKREDIIAHIIKINITFRINILHKSLIVECFAY